MGSGLYESTHKMITNKKIGQETILQVTLHAHHNSVFRLTVSLVAIAILFDRKGKNVLEHETIGQNSLLSLDKQSNIA